MSIQKPLETLIQFADNPDPRAPVRAPRMTCHMKKFVPCLPELHCELLASRLLDWERARIMVE